jgi:two-component system response regulator DegU
MSVFPDRTFGKVSVWPLRPLKKMTEPVSAVRVWPEPVKRRTRVILADDHPGFRAAIRRLLEKAGDIEVVAEAENGAQAMEMANQYGPDILLLDLEMPDLHGAEVASKLNESGSTVRVLALSGLKDRQVILGMCEIGAKGYLVKDEAPELLLEAIRCVAHGDECWLSDDTHDLLHS